MCFMRKEELLYDKWLFHKGDITVPRPAEKGPVYTQSKTERRKIGPAAYYYTDSPSVYITNGEAHSERWEYVTLPHDYIIGQDMTETENNALGYMKYENAWYRRHFTIDESYRDKRITLQFDGIASQSVIYLNGCLMKHNYSAYNSFEVDISDVVYFGKDNVLAVYVNTEEFEGWWYQGGGIYRDVRLVVTDKVSIDRYGVYAPVKKLDDGTWSVSFETTVRNDGDCDADFTVKSILLDADGNVAAEASASGNAEFRGKLTVTSCAKISDPHLWDTDDPYLYTVKTVLYSDGGEIDENRVQIGFRTVEADPDKGLFINGRHVLVKGVCGHQDFGLTGIAVPNNIMRYKIELYKEMGANAFRTSHYQHASATMDACDEFGMLVMDEVRHFESTDEGIAQLEELVKRDRNRPSVIMWSTSNEEPFHITDNGRRIHKSLCTVIKKLDRTRLITCAEDARPRESTVYADCDVIGINYNLDAYADVHKMYPDKPMVASECCATGTTRDWNITDNSDGRLRDRDMDSNIWFRSRESTWKFIADNPYIMGGFQWAAFEHRGEATWPAVCSKSGALDLFLRRKGAFWQNMSHWTKAPMVHIVPHWNFKGLEGSNIEVPVYTNCDELELFVNGKSLGRKVIEKYGHGEWSVPYEPGELKAVGYCAGEKTVEDVRKTSKRPERLKLHCENSADADGRSILIFTCVCVDEDGAFVPDAAEYVKFSVSGPAKIVGTGSDNCDHKNVQSDERKMYAGVITVGVQPQKSQKELTLFAQSDRLGMASIKYEF